MKAATKIKPKRTDSKHVKTDRDTALVPIKGLKWALPGGIAIVTFLVFSPALRNGFVDWDDYQVLLQNPNYRGLGWSNLSWMFTTNYQSLYRPLTWLTLGIDYLLWGMNPWGYHLTSILIHTANAVLFYYLTQQLLLLSSESSAERSDLSIQIPALFATLIFAVHPLRVEAVAWISALNDILSGLFFLLTIIFYLEYGRREANHEGRTGVWLAAAIGAYACSLLSKASAVTLPLVLLLLDFIPLRRLTARAWFDRRARKILWEKLPFFFLAALTALAAVAAKSEGGAVASLRAHGLDSRLAQSFYGLAFYIWKTIVPTGLSPFYELPPHLDPLAWPILVSAGFVTALTVIFLLLRRRWPAGLANWVYYMLILAPVLGIVQIGRQIVADRYSYLACLGWTILAAGGVRHLWNTAGKEPTAQRKRMLVSTAGAAVVLVLAAMTRMQLGVWHDTDALWNHVLAVTDTSFFRSGTAHHVVARILSDRGDLAQTIKHLRISLEIEPDDSTTYADLGTALARQGNLTEAMRNLQTATNLNPSLTLAHLTLGNILAIQGHLAAAEQEFRYALAVDPNYAPAYHNLGKILAAQGQLDGAIDLFRQAVKIQPEFAEAHQSLAMALEDKGNREEAAQESERARRILRTTNRAPQAK